MRLTLYLPDELGQRAKDADLNLSRLLREAVERELRGEAQGPAVEIERHGASVEIRVGLPVDDLREHIDPR
jgi:post-segregation antitoxin (ccd killing protein)